MKEFAVLGFGEIMMRLSPNGRERISQSETFVKHAGGSELNVVSGITRLGLRTGLISKLPNNIPGQYIRGKIRSYGVSDDFIINDDDPNARLGVYYYESGVYPRKPQINYDRNFSSFQSVIVSDFPEDLFNKTEIFHISGISLALGKTAQTTAIELIKRFKDAGAAISFDVNYRANLWSENDARDIIHNILPMVDLLFVSEETSRRMLQRTGSLEEIMKGFYKEYDTKVVASTQREVISPSHHNFNSLIYAGDYDQLVQGIGFKNIEVIDRIGSGDAYISGVLYSLLKGKALDEVVEYGNAMSAIKSTIAGDLISTDLKEVENIIDDLTATGYLSELNR